MMMTTIPATYFKFKLHPSFQLHHHHRKSKLTLFNKLIKLHPSLNFDYGFSLLARSPRGGDAETSSQHSSVSDMEQNYNEYSSGDDTYLPLLIRMLGLDNDILDREQAVVALWKYALGGKQYVNNIMQFPGCVNLTVHLLRSESSQVSEAASGLLRMISSSNSFRDLVAQSGAIEETTALLRRPSLNPEVKEQSICLLWNLSSDEKYSVKIANTALLPLLIKFLDDEDSKVVEAAAGVLANLSLSRPNHSIMVEADVIPKMAKFLTNEVEASKVIRKATRNALLELAKDDYYRSLIMEEGLVLVPLVGTAAYASYKPGLHSWPSLPDGTEFTRSSKGPSRYGANELLLGLNIKDNTDKIDQYKMEAIVGRTQQQFLARIGAIETEDEKKPGGGFSSGGFYQTLLPWKDGVARLVLILELEDEMAVIRAANAIAQTSINKHLCVYFREAGVVKHLVYLLNHPSDEVKSAVVNALEKLSLSNAICRTMEAEGVIKPLVNMLQDSNKTESLTEQVISILSRILDPNNEMKLKFYDGPVNGSRQETDSINGDDIEKVEDVMGPTLIGFFVDTVKTASARLQAKAASILEFLIITEQCVDAVLSTSIESSLIGVFEQKAPKVIEPDIEEPKLEDPYDEEAYLAISAASRLLTRLLDHKQFRDIIDSDRFTKSLRQILKSSIPLHYKDWVASALIKLTSSQIPFDDDPVTTEVTLYETIPRLIEQIDTSPSVDVQENAVIQLNRIVSEGVVDATRVVADKGGIFPLVKLIECGSERAVEAGLAILYSLSMDSNNHSAILAAGAAPVLRKIVISERPQWMKALLLLRNLPV